MCARPPRRAVLRPHFPLSMRGGGVLLFGGRGGRGRGRWVEAHKRDAISCEESGALLLAVWVAARAGVNSLEPRVIDRPRASEAGGACAYHNGAVCPRAVSGGVEYRVLLGVVAAYGEVAP